VFGCRYPFLAELVGMDTSICNGHGESSVAAIEGQYYLLSGVVTRAG